MNQWELEGAIPEITMILKQYDLGHELQIIPITGHLCKITTSRGTFGVKSVPFSTDRVKYLYQINQHLINKGFSGVSEMLVDEQGTPYFLGGDGKVYYVYKWKEGQSYRFNNHQRLLSATIKLAELHKNAEGFFPYEVVAPQRWGKWPEKFRDRAMTISTWFNEDGLPSVDSELWSDVKNHGPYFLEQALLATEMVSSPAYQYINDLEQGLGTFCHRDYAARNLLEVEGQTLHILDFDYSIGDIRIYDLARFIQITAVLNKWDWGVGAQVLKEYHQIRPLNEAEISVLSATLWFPRRFWLYANRLRHETHSHRQAQFTQSLQQVYAEEGLRVAFVNQLQAWKLPRAKK